MQYQGVPQTIDLIKKDRCPAHVSVVNVDGVEQP